MSIHLMVTSPRGREEPDSVITPLTVNRNGTTGVDTSVVGDVGCVGETELMLLPHPNRSPADSTTTQRFMRHLRADLASAVQNGRRDARPRVPEAPECFGLTHPSVRPRTAAVKHI